MTSIFGEDLLFNIEAFLLAKRVYFTTTCYYHYVKNDTGATNDVKNIERNCIEFIENYFLTEKIISKCYKYTEDSKKLLATSRFKHFVHWYLNRMLVNRLYKEILSICLNNEKLLQNENSMFFEVQKKIQGIFKDNKINEYYIEIL